MARRFRSRTISVDVDVDIDDVLSEMPEEDLVIALQEHGYVVTKAASDTELMEAYTAIRQGRVRDAEAMIEKMIWPKWGDVSQCEKAYNELRKSA